MKLLRTSALIAAQLGCLYAQSPQLHSVQVMGGTGFDSIKSIAPDGAGNLYVLGTTQSPDFPATVRFGPASTAENGKGNTFVAKVHLADWSLAWCAIISPSTPLAIAVDGAGAAYITGTTDSPALFPTTHGSFVSSTAGTSGVLFVLKLNPQGTQITYASLLGFIGPNNPAPIVVGPQGEAYVASQGSIQTTPGAFIGSVDGGLFLSKLTADGGRQVFATYLTNSGSAGPRAIALDAEQNIVLAGFDDGDHPAIKPTPGAIQSVNAGGEDAFVMKVRSDGSGITFATLLGGRGGDAASYLQIAADGSIYVAGRCEYGTGSSPDTPFPTTSGAPYQQFMLFNGFVARIDSTGTRLLFSTYISDVSNAGAAGLALVAGVAYAPFNYVLSRGFLGLGLTPLFDPKVDSTRMAAFHADGSLASAPVDLIGLTPDAFAVDGDAVLVGSNSGQINRPVPSSIAAIGSAGSDLRPRPYMALGKFVLNATPDHDLDADHGYVVLESNGLNPAGPFTLNLTSSAGAVPFQIFGPLPNTSCCVTEPLYTITPSSGVTPATVTITPDPSVTGSYAAFATPLLLVSPFATQPIQILPSTIKQLTPQITATVVPNLLVLPTSGGSATGVIQVRATANSLWSSQPVDVPTSFEFQGTFGFLPRFLTFSSLRGTTPADIAVTAQDDSLQPGGSEAGFLDVVPTGSRNNGRLVVPVVRPGSAPTPPVVNPTYLTFTDYGARSAILTRTVQVTPPGADSTFKILGTASPRLQVQPTSGTGPMALTVAVDLSKYPTGSTQDSFTVEVGGSPVVVNVSVMVNGPSLQLVVGFLNTAESISPGLRATILGRSSLWGLPSTGAWSNASPAPTSWNGYAFVYGGNRLPILSADPAGLAFEVQFPYDIDVTKAGLPINMMAPDGTVYASAQWYSNPQPSSIGLATTAGPFQLDGTAVSADNPVLPGDTIRLSLVGAGVTSPPIDAGVLPEPGAVHVPVVSMRVAIGGKDATISSLALSRTLVGVTDLTIVVPKVASGLQMLGVVAQGHELYQIPVWVSAH